VDTFIAQRRSPYQVTSHNKVLGAVLTQHATSGCWGCSRHQPAGHQLNCNAATTAWQLQTLACALQGFSNTPSPALHCHRL
jgi:hypothetical protein